ncbi:uncharacterized protein YecT (DUF1311 family) [Rhizobium sp. WW_1]|jgi:uncharacterized protein YecT (DUF1311 family)|nr:uncharacterized protein YecT (DUF1311 family) [Rhizobium sp. WW_1]
MLELSPVQRDIDAMARHISGPRSRPLRWTRPGRRTSQALCLWALIVAAGILPCPQSFAAAPALCARAQDQTARTLCVADKLKTAEIALDQAYAALDAKLEPLGKRNLKLAQEAWLKFRDLECNLETGRDPDRLGRDGTIMPMLLGECAIALTEQRTRDLSEQLKCPGGDLSCEP